MPIKCGVTNRQDIFGGVRATTVDIDKIVVLSEVQPRTQINKKHVDELTDVLSRNRFTDKIGAFKDPDTKELVLVSGFHRLAAYRRVDETKVKCDGTCLDKDKTCSLQQRKKNSENTWVESDPPEGTSSWVKVKTNREYRCNCLK